MLSANDRTRLERDVTNDYNTHRDDPRSPEVDRKYITLRYVMLRHLRLLLGSVVYDKTSAYKVNLIITDNSKSA